MRQSRMVLCIRSLLVLATLMSRATSKSCGPAVEEGSSIEISCLVSESPFYCENDDVTWFVETPGFNNKKTCLLGPLCKQGRERPTGYSSLTTTSSFTQRSKLTIMNVSRLSVYRQHSVWTCQLCRKKSLACDDLKIYSKPKDARCSTHYLKDEDKNIRWIFINCSTSLVFPQAKCEFTGISNTAELQLTKPPIYNHTLKQKYPNYYSSRCSITIPIAELGLNSYQFEVLIYPGETGGQAHGVVVRTEEMVVESAEQEEKEHGMEKNGNDEPNKYKTASVIVTVIAAIIIFILIIIIVVIARAYVARGRRQRKEELYEDDDIGLTNVNGRLDASGINPASEVYEGYVSPSTMHSPAQDYEAYTEPSNAPSPGFYNSGGYSNASDSGAYNVLGLEQEEKAHYYQDMVLSNKKTSQKN